MFAFQKSFMSGGEPLFTIHDAAVHQQKQNKLLASIITTGWCDVISVTFTVILRPLVVSLIATPEIKNVSTDFSGAVRKFEVRQLSANLIIHF